MQHQSKKDVWLGVWLVILPFLGFPSAWKEWLVILTGLALLGVSGMHFRRIGRGAPQKEASADTLRGEGAQPSTPSSGAL